MEQEKAQRTWAAMNNLVYFGAGYLLRELILRAQDGKASKEEEGGIFEKMVSIFSAAPHKLRGTCGYVFYQPESSRKLHQTVEACVSDFESAMNAWKGGVNSLELCADRPQGGVTPSQPFIETVARILRSRGVQINVLVRPRPGSFVYNTEEFDILTSEVRMAKEAGATGIVVGVLDDNGYIHQPRMKLIRDLCSSLGLQLTFHRAFDVCSDPPDKALEIIGKLGCDRLLTSGRRDAVIDSEALLLVEKLQRMATGAVQVVAAAGIKPENVASVILATNVRAIHCGSGITSKRIHNYGLGYKEDFKAANASGLNASWDEVDQHKAARLVENAFNSWRSLGLIDEAGTEGDPLASVSPFTDVATPSRGGADSYIVIDEYQQRGASADTSKSLSH